MKKSSTLSYLTLLILLASLLSPVQAGPAALDEPTALVYVALANPGDLARFEATGLPAYARLHGTEGDYLLAGADPAGLEALAAAGLSHQVLDQDVDGHAYYLAYLMPGRPQPKWSDYGDMLHDDGLQVLLRSTPDRAEALAQSGVEIRALTLDPKPLRPALDPDAIPTVIDPDPLIQTMIDQVISPTVYQYDGNLSGEWPVDIGGSPYIIATRHTASGTPIQQATQFAYEHLDALGLTMEYHDWSRSGYSGRNVIGQVPGQTNPDDIYIICAHIDDMPPGPLAPGADDNASGVVAVLMAAEILTQYNWGCTLRFALWTGEEQGLLGSYVYAQRSYNAGENIVGVLNLDMIAYNTIDSSPDIDLHADQAGVPPSMQLAQLFADVVDAYNLNLIPQIVPNGSGGSDHASFWSFGYTAILGIEDFGDFNPYYHTTNDLLSNTDIDYFTEFVKASVGTIAHMSCLLPSGLGTIEGQVASTDGGTPIVGATVTAHDDAGHSFPATTDAGGYYTRTLLAGTYTVTAGHPQYTSAFTGGVVVVTNTATTVDFALVPRGRLWGYVSDYDNGFPLAATISAPGGRSANTDPASGLYELYLDEGAHVVEATAPDYISATAAISIVSGQDTHQNFALMASVALIPAPVHVFVLLDSTYSTTAALTNRMAGPYDFEFYEIPGGFIPATQQPQAAWPGPDGYGYTGEAVDYDWIDISASGVPVPLSDDSYAGPFALGFSFSLYGTDYTQFYVGSNGFVSFGGGSADRTNDCPLPNGGTPNNIVALMWDDLNPDSGGNVYYQSFGSCPIGVGSCTVVAYHNVPHYNGSDAGTFEAVLFDNGSVLLQYQDAGSEAGSGSTTAIEGNNADADYGLTYACNTGSSLGDGDALCFVYPGSPGCVAGEVPWLGQEPTSGTVPAGSSLPITLHFTATSAAGVDQPGDYYADMVVNGNPKLRVPVTMTVITICLPVDILTVTAAVAGCQVDFSAELDGVPPFDYVWHFGDGLSSTLAAPSHVYAISGTYTTTLEVWNCAGAYSDSQILVLTVTCGAPCAPVEILSVTAEISACQVAFGADLAGDPPFETLWSFGDGLTSTLAAPFHVYTSSGTYTTTLEVWNCAGTYSDSQILALTVTCEQPPCVPVEILSVTAEISACQVAFGADLAGDEPFETLWAFGDGLTSTLAAPFHVYTISGTYTTTLEVWNCAGTYSDSHILALTVTCEPPCTPVHAVDLVWEPITPTVGEVVVFTASASGTMPITYSWELGSWEIGELGIGNPITHTYTMAGLYTVTLTATNACGVGVVNDVVSVSGMWKLYLPIVFK